MNFLPDTTLAHYDTMRLGGPAKVIAELTSEDDIVEAVAYAQANNLKILVIGQGSNIVFGDSGFDGLVLINRIAGVLIEPISGLVRVGAGVPWHQLVVKTVEAGLIGIEAMALIPGSTGATPVNNVGAYGQEIKDVLVSLRAFDTQTNQFVQLTNADCSFGYRTSRFKTADYGRFVISSLTLQLKPETSVYQPPAYPSLEAVLSQKDLDYPTASDVMQCVIELRSEKLPDPVKLANAGSFFTNPIVDSGKADHLVSMYPDLPHYPQTDGSEKLAAGWLVEKAGLKGLHEHGMWVYDKQALVLVNESAQTFADLQAMVSHIQQVVHDTFDVDLVPEPEIFA